MLARPVVQTTLLGRYRVAETVGHGEFGRVLRVIDTHAQEPRALKIAVRGEALLLDEFEQLAALRHPSLPRVYEVGRTTETIDDVPPGAPYFIAEWIAGGRADARAWDDPRALWLLLADVGGALATIHAAGLVHGDVAPQNILLVEADARAVLVDLGLGRAYGARGTPATMAPEAFAGIVEPRSDLYALGATCVQLVTGKPAFDAPTLAELVRRVLTATAPPALPGMPRPIADLIGRLMARDVDARPASALALLDELDQLASLVGVTRRARPTVRAAPAAAMWPGGIEIVDALARDLATGNAVCIVAGTTAAGVRQIADGAVRRWQLGEVAAARKAPTLSGTLDELATLLRVPSNESASRWLDAVARAIRKADALCIVELADDPRARDAIAALARHAQARPTIAHVERAPADRAGVVVHLAPALDLDGTRALAQAMLGTAPQRAWAQALHAISGGEALTAIELLRSIASEPDPLAVDWTARSSAGAQDLRARLLRSTGDSARTLAIIVAAWGGRVRLDRALATGRDAGARVALADAAELERAGLARRQLELAGDVLALDRATVDAALALATAEQIDAFARAGLANAGDAPAETIVPLLERVAMDRELARRACDVADQLLSRGRADRARAIAMRALAAEPARAGLLAARAAAGAGQYADVEPLATAAQRAGADPIAAQLVIARAAQRAGDLDAAEAALGKLHVAHPDHHEVAGTYARLLVTRARFADARRVVATVPSPLAGLRAEAAGLAAFYLGELDEADRAFAALELGGAAAGDHATVGRALSMRGMVAQQRGQLGLASDRYREAARRLDEVGEIHAAATAELNLGTALVERGRASEALPRLAAASRVFAELGATTEQVAADLNRGNALVAVGQLEEARAAAAAALARSDGAPHLRAFALIVLGDAQRRLGDEAAAERSDREALAIAIEGGDAHAQVSACIALAEAGHQVDQDVDALCASDDDRDRWIIADARLALHRPGTRGRAELVALARSCADAATRATDADRLERAFRGHAVAAQLAQRGRDGQLARAEGKLARSAHAALVAAAAPAFRAALEADPDAARLPELEAPAPPSVRSDDGAALMRRLLTLSRRLNSEASVERILDEVIDTAIELTAAERGFLLLRQGNGELAPVVSRNFATSDLAVPSGASGAVSRSIAERAAQTGEPVLTVDAGVDERFAIAASVAALRLRSVLAVPLRQRGTITGCIYVDHRLRGGAFDEGAAAVLGELADIAAIAIENARLTDDLKRSTRAVDELNSRLNAELADREAELARVKADLPDRDRLRHRYERIVGRSPAMVKMLELVDRAAATSLPVVIVGESGTGKELIARALHDHGPRRNGAFVAINCSAVPEPLLESELFGHARGAFTGADRDRRGLFEVADGGTLLLDEVADTSPAMQAKLLRVLQDGVIRRVGETATRTADVRVVAATQRPLADLVTAGRFREDLRFRLEVIAIAIPPLRDREGDVPLLVDAMLARMVSGKRPPRLTRAALRALSQHRWPGNVRELENALARGIAMGGDVMDVEDLPEAIAVSAARPEPAKPASGEDLRLKPALLATEQAYLSAAMARAKGNQTVAARLLGLSRFGLQKKLRRLSGEDAGDDEE